MYYITNFYYFIPIESPEAASNELLALEPKSELSGLVILANEGINGTIAGTSIEVMQVAKNWIKNRFQIPESQFKDSTSQVRPFRHGIKTRLRSEIVTLDRPDIQPVNDTSYLTPKEWHEMLKNDDSIRLIDTRNDYEYKIGTFKNAINPKIDQFTQFPEFMKSRPDIKKDDTVFIFCTGGIRCEKARVSLKEMGYQKVYQLHGGILRYLEQYPNQEFQGECFVFDDRVAVDQNLQESKNYKLCPLCGDPAGVKVTCAHCGKLTQLCEDCSSDQANSTCSKNCRHHHLRTKSTTLSQFSETLV